MLKVYKNSDELSKSLAKHIVTIIKKKENITLGCPGGRSLKKTYKYIGILSYKMNVDLSKVKIFMMDEYVIKNKNKFKTCNTKLHYSCVGYSYRVIQKLFNYKKNIKKLIKSNIFFPKIDKIKDYDKMIKKLGGIDIFLLASGTTDGHVAFNNFKSNINSSTHITKLSKQTRLDNLKTFPKFKSIREVPKYGITVGLGTIYKLTKKAILVLSGKEKKKAAKIILSKKFYSNQWPAIIVYKCKKQSIYIDMDALGSR